jgi:hypothetical protein
LILLFDIRNEGRMSKIDTVVGSPSLFAGAIAAGSRNSPPAITPAINARFPRAVDKPPGMRAQGKDR